MILHIIRHGETVYNAQKRLQGQRNIPLSLTTSNVTNLLRAKLSHERPFM